MTREEFEKRLKERLKNATNDYKKELEKIKEDKIEDTLDLYLRDKKIKILNFKLINRIMSENNADITSVSPKNIKGIAKYNEIYDVEFEINFNE
ncbi:hypothetical protein I6E36_08530 [Fusobacterium mortiferum]|uniref:hypothetical protein n=1 Tax=Fusobacterium mortiferum TaxID=850 RepID=UPI001F2E3B2C|nr:hypothetical protein [Fusobacterium mortiferum]MCF2628127.1 hypothetical protein [Fusobacterium mortiferum]MCF2638798.1 hypothetical protein [Fusobacterium varium]